MLLGTGVRHPYIPSYCELNTPYHRITASKNVVSATRLDPSLQRSSRTPSLSISSEFLLQYKSRMLLGTEMGHPLHTSALFAYQRLQHSHRMPTNPHASPPQTQSVEYCSLSEETKAALKKVWAGDTSKLNM